MKKSKKTCPHIIKIEKLKIINKLYKNISEKQSNKITKKAIKINKNKLNKNFAI